MEHGGNIHCSLKGLKYGKIPKNIDPSENLIFPLNISHQQRVFDIHALVRRDSMRKDILNTVSQRVESKMLDTNIEDDTVKYEDPRDLLGDKSKPPKPPRKRNTQGIGVVSPRKDKSAKDQKRRLIRKYESLITTLMERCEENLVMISEKDSHVLKLKEKLKAVLEFNKSFAEENDHLKSQYATMVKYIEDCKNIVKEERDKKKVLEVRCKELEERVRRFEVPDRDTNPEKTAIPLVEVCMSCSSRQILLNQAKEQNARLQKDMHALKDVLYRLNVQLSRYQEKIRSNTQTMTLDGKTDNYKTTDKFEPLDSLLASSWGYKGQETTDEVSQKSLDEQVHSNKVVDLSGLLSAQALAPLFDAYQENLQEKDCLILDYEKQFENMNKKSKKVVDDNRSLQERVTSLEEELSRVRQSYKKAVVEKETCDIEKATLVERAEKAESKLKEVYELYEDKMAAMMRDYETVHREYFAVKGALEVSENKMAALDVMRARTVPADLHERRLEHCKRLLEELKHQYGMETERKCEQLKKLQEQLKDVEDKYNKIHQEHEAGKEELRQALKNVKLYRKAAAVFRQRVKSTAARMQRVRRSVKRAKCSGEPLRQALTTLERIKQEIKVVKSRAHTSLEELERRIVEQEKRATLAQSEYRRELERANIALEHKEGIIKSLIDKVADVEEVRLSQTNTHRLQGIVTDSSPDPSASSKLERKDKSTVKLVPGAGGYFQDGRKKK